MTIKKWQIVVLSCLLSTSVSASRRDTDYGYGGVPIVGTISVGPGWSRPGQDQTINLQPDIVKSYVPGPTSSAFKWVTTAQGTDTIGTGELFLGFYGAVNSVVEGQIGVVYSQSTQARLSGTIYEDANPAFNNYKYSYQIRNARVGLKAKALVDTKFYDLIGYISGSGAAGMNHSSRFSITPLLDTEVPAPAFTDHTSTSFSYTFGIGFEVPVDPNWRVGLGYEWANWGMSQLSRAPGQTVGNGLHLPALRVQSLMVSLSFLG